MITDLMFDIQQKHRHSKDIYSELSDQLISLKRQMPSEQQHKTTEIL